MSAYTTGVDLMKACRARPATINDLIGLLGMDQVSVRRWVREYEGQGVLVCVGKVRDEATGHSAFGYQLGKHWGGTAC
jgi:hypothetical protein